MPQAPGVPQKGKPIVDFLVKLAKDPALKAAYAKDADGTMKAARLTKEQRDLVLGGDLNAIRQAVGAAGLRTIVWQTPTVWQ